MIIGNVRFENNIFLAPMAGITDMPFRILCKEFGCGLVYTEMVSAKGMHYNDKKSNKIALISEEEKPAGIQIFGSEPLVMGEIAYKLNDSDACLIDINMGCPAPKITKGGEGSALMQKPELVKKIVREVVRQSEKPVTVKIRKGWDENSINAVEIAQIAEDEGAMAITVHGRTREQQYSGKADWDIIKAVKSAVKIPVIGNGDVIDGQSAKEMFEKTGCDAVMIGRAVQGNPWIFATVLQYQKDGSIPERPSATEMIDMIKRHLNMLILHKGPHTGIVEMRKHIAWYIKGMRNCTYLRDEIFKTHDKDKIISLLENYL